MIRRDPFAEPERLIRRVYAYVAYRIGDGPDAEDVTSEVFERALRRRASYDPAKGEPIAWLLGIARRVIADHVAARPAAGGDLSETASPEDLEEQAVLVVTLAGALATLDQRDRELIALRYGADLPAREIGRLLDLRTNTVEVALHRALARLRARLQPEVPGEAPALSLSDVRI